LAALATPVPGLRPDLPVVYLSGYVQRTVAWAGLPGVVIGFVGKPIEMDALLTTVPDVLER
jgi:DNA-binding NtrC family response regulator